MGYDPLKTDILITQMENIRTKNNVNWMDLVRLAFELDPTRSKEIIKQIVNNDKAIASVLEKLAE